MVTGLRGLILSVLLASCVRSNSTTCGTELCPEGTVCSAYSGRALCVDPAQVEACKDSQEREPCTVGELEGSCRGGACLRIGCGNGIVDDPFYGTNENCDDHNRLSHDGCSSTCQVERPGFDQIGFDAVERVYNHAMTLDTGRGRIFMYGGANYGAVPVNWNRELREQGWQEFRNSLNPGNRSGHAMANDGRRHRLVVFGGRRTQLLGDTWEWDGTGWTLFRPVTSPAARFEHAMAFDPVRNVTVLFGGRTSVDVLNDTWEWNGTEWTERELATQPPARSAHAMTYDPARNVIVLVGEPVAGVVDTWEYNGVDWRETTGSRPPVGTQIAIAFDALDRKVILQGGTTGANALTWISDGTTWTSRATSLPGLVDTALATDLVSGHVVLHGGNSAAAGQPPNVTAATWRWDGLSWSQLPPPLAAPSPREQYWAALDQHRGRLVLYGGVVRDTGIPTTETYELGSDGWILAQPATNPGPRQGHTMAYHLGRKQTVLFGGLDDHTWIWNGAEWTERVTTPAPPARVNAAMAYDADRGVIVMFGGSTPGLPPVDLTDVWEWNGDAWTQIFASGPGPRSNHAMAYDRITKRTLLYGGSSARTQRGDTWAWSGQTWTQLEPVISPGVRLLHGLAWDPTRQRVVMVGGAQTGNFDLDAWEWNGLDWLPLPGTTFSTTQRFPLVSGLDGSGVVAVTAIHGGRIGGLRLRWTASGALESCGDSDADQDGLRGCADPDCWATCAPACPPGVSCAANESRCGDQTCSALETKRSCPADCGDPPVLCGDFVCAPGEHCPGDCDW